MQFVTAGSCTETFESPEEANNFLSERAASKGQEMDVEQQQTSEQIFHYFRALKTLVLDM